MVETAREPEFGYPKIDITENEESNRGVSWDPIFKDIQKSAENNDQLWLERILANHQKQEKLMKLRLQRVTSVNLDRHNSIQRKKKMGQNFKDGFNNLLENQGLGKNKVLYKNP